MPAAASAEAAAPPTSCFRVSRTSGLCRSPGSDPHERAHHAIQVVKHLLVGVRLGNVLAKPCTASCSRATRRAGATDRHPGWRCTASQASTRTVSRPSGSEKHALKWWTTLPLLDGRVVAPGEPRVARISAEDHVHLVRAARKSGVEEEELHEVRAIRIHRLAVEHAVEPCVERVRQPRGAVHRRPDPVGELLPAMAVRARGLARRRRRARLVGAPAIRDCDAGDDCHDHGTDEKRHGDGLHGASVETFRRALAPRSGTTSAQPRRIGRRVEPSECVEVGAMRRSCGLPSKLRSSAPEAKTVAVDD